MSALTLSALTLSITSILHSYLGERYLLSRIFHFSTKTPIFPSPFFKQTLRFAWHLTIIIWLGSALILYILRDTTELTDREKIVLRILEVVYGLHGFVAAGASRGKHLAWIAFLGVAGGIHISLV